MVKVMAEMAVKVFVGGMTKVMEKCRKTNSESDGTSNGKRDGTDMGGSHGIYTNQNNENVEVMAVVVMVGVQGSEADEYKNDTYKTLIHGLVGGWLGRWAGGRMDRWMDACMLGWMDG